MKKIVIGLVVAVLVGAAAAVALQFAPRALHSGLPVAAVLPADTVYYVEARHLRDQWQRARTTEAWRDLESSTFLTAVRAYEEDGVSVAAGSAEFESKFGYELSTENILKFVGRSAALAVWPDPNGAWHPIVVAEIDVEAIVKDLLTGGGDWRALHAELARRAELAGAKVSEARRGDYTITSVAGATSTRHFTLLEDLLVVSDSALAVESAVDRRVANGAGSLEKLPAFHGEIDRLAPDSAFVDWLNLDAVRARRAAIDGADNPGGAALVAVADCLRGASVARSVLLPDGDLYRVSWAWSRPDAELFVDTTSLAFAHLEVPGAWMQIHANGLARVADAWQRSALKTHLESSWLGTKMGEVWEKARREMHDDATSQMAEIIGNPLDDAFLRRMGEHVALSMIDSLVDADVVCSAGGPVSGEMIPSAVWGLRLGTDGRVLAQALLAAARREGRAHARTVRCGDLDVFLHTFDEPKEFVAATVGDALLVATSADALAAGVRAADATGPSTTPLGGLLESLPPDARFTMTLDFAALREAFAAGLRDAGGPDPFALLGATRFAAGLYVDDVLSRVDVHWRLALDGASQDLRDAQGSVPAGPPAAFASLPDGAIYAGTMRMDLQRTLTAQLATLSPELGLNLDEAEDGVREALGISLRKELLPAFGPEYTFGILRSLDATGGSPPIPGIVLLAQVRDRTVAERFITRLGDLATRETGDGAPMSFVVSRLGDAPLLRMVPDPRSDIPVRPALTIVGDYLTLVSDDELLDRIQEARAGGASYATSATEQQVRADGLEQEGHAFSRLDWSALVDQLAVYTPQMAEMFASFGGGPDFPEYPADADDPDAEWERLLQEFDAARRNSASDREADVRGALHTLRCIEYIASQMRQEGATQSGHVIVRLVR